MIEGKGPGPMVPPPCAPTPPCGPPPMDMQCCDQGFGMAPPPPMQPPPMAPQGCPPGPCQQNCGPACAPGQCCPMKKRGKISHKKKKE